MYKLNKNTTAIFLISSSLTLLFVFLGSWIHGVYQHEKEALQKEINYTIKDAIGSLEDSIMQKVFLQKIIVEDDSTLVKPNSISKKMTLRLDTKGAIDLPDHRIHEEIISDSLVQMFVRTTEDSVDLGHGAGFLSLLVNWESENMHSRMSFVEDVSKTIDLISAKFEKQIQKTDLPKSYHIAQIGLDESTKGVVGRFYEFPHKNEAYVAIFSDYFWYVIQKMKHQILISLLLFSAISISFFMIYSNWRQQQKLIDIKNDFISNVTHELKTPISTVSVALEALSRFDVMKDKEKTSEYLAISKLELNRLRILVDKVLKMSIFEKGATQLSLEYFDMAVLLHEVLSSMKIQFERVKADVSSHLEGEDFNIKADKIHLTNVLYNLLDNALKYSPEDPKIDILLKDVNGTVELNIKDHGLGITKEDQSHIFDRFYRVPTGDTHNIKGHGLGLSYVATIIAQHKGSISLESELSRGSTFKISLKKHAKN